MKKWPKLKSKYLKLSLNMLMHYLSIALIDQYWWSVPFKYMSTALRQLIYNYLISSCWKDPHLILDINWFYFHFLVIFSFLQFFFSYYLSFQIQLIQIPSNLGNLSRYALFFSHLNFFYFWILQKLNDLLEASHSFTHSWVTQQ